MASKKTLEINPYHPIISELAKKIKDSPEDESAKEMAFILYDSCLITAGFDIDDQVIVFRTFGEILSASLQKQGADVLFADAIQHSHDEDAS
jgi:molecular chaperone HtpG